ncbi:MAG: hypothetical protein IJF83_10215 [Methanobrevibacter sp.]|nr:hypothetical protein [Methanobrevibacter sp.]
MKWMIIVLVFFLAVSAVSAADNQTFTNLQDIIDQTPENGVVNLTSDYTYSDGDSQITISHPLTINGNNHILNGKSKTVIMIVYSDNVILNNITFTNGYASDGSGALEANNATVTNCIFTNNHGDNGGAIYSSKGKIDHCTFINNSADYDGGALVLSDSTITNSLFDNNHATNGGAVLSTEGMIFNCRFINNHADLDGGAVYSYLGNVERSSFINNSAGLTGGALNLVIAKAKDCYFENNSAKYYGGAIFNEEGEVENCTFKNNSAWKGNDVYSPSNYDDIDINSNRSNGREKVFHITCDTDSTGNPLGLLLAGLALPISRKLKR